MSGRRSALIIATDTYEDAALHALAAPSADARALADVLGDEDLGDFEVATMHNPSDHEVRIHIQRTMASAAPDDLIVVHFSCHGLKNESGELFLATHNTHADLLDATGVSAAWISRLMQRSRARSIVLFLDCCYGGAFDRGFVSRSDSAVHVSEQFDPGQLGGGRGRIVVTASGATEFALEGGAIDQRGEFQPSVFTGALVDGIRAGTADRDEDGYVGLDELYEHIFNEVRAKSPTMTPELSSFGQRGLIRIARSPRRSFAPIEPPTEVVAALEGSPFSRMGAVHALAKIATGPEVGRALGAVALLRRLSDDDSRSVSDAASEALSEVRPVLTPTDLDLGVVTASDMALVEDLEVQGPPVVLACSASSSTPHIRANWHDSQLRLRISRQNVGPLRGFVELSGAPGVAKASISIEVVAPQAEPAHSEAPETSHDLPSTGGEGAEPQELSSPIVVTATTRKAGPRKLEFNLSSGGAIHTLSYGVGLWYTLRFDGIVVRRFNTSSLEAGWAAFSFVMYVGAHERLIEFAVGHKMDGAVVKSFRLAVDGDVLRERGEKPPSDLIYKRVRA